MASPTTRANEVWEVNGSDDILQLKSRGSGNLGGIDSTGAGYGSLSLGGIVRTAIVTLTSAQLLALSTTPVVIVPSPGPGLYIVPQALAAQYNAGTVPYTVTGSGGLIVFGYAGDEPITADNSVITVFDTGFVDQVTSQLFISSTFSENAIPLSHTVNNSFVCQCLDVLTLGNGTVQFTLSYVIATA